MHMPGNQQWSGSAPRILLAEPSDLAALADLRWRLCSGDAEDEAIPRAKSEFLLAGGTKATQRTDVRRAISMAKEI